MQVLQFDIEKYPFHKVIGGFLDTDELDLLQSDTSNEGVDENNSFYKNMEQTKLFKQMYQKLNGPDGKAFYELYNRFIEEVIRPEYSEAIYYQRRPSHRILFRDIAGQTKFHKDSDYGHSSDEVNYWVPQTKAFETNSIWVEEKAGTAKYKPAELELGEFLEFDGASLSHGAFPNETEKTRVSFDFRVIPASKMKEDDKDKDMVDGETNPIMSNVRKFVFCE